MTQNFGDLEGVETDIDDILVWGKTEEEHHKRLKAVLQRCQDIHLTLNMEKCKFGASQVTYLGHIISAAGISLDKDRVKAISEMPPPTDRKGVERILGTLNYVAKFVPDMSRITQPIRELLKQDTQFIWEYEQEAAFEAIKTRLSTAPVLAFFDVQKKVTVSCDASQSGLGAVLLQEGQPIAYVSRALTSTETRYAQIEKELLAVVFALERFHQYTYGKTVDVELDHKPLEAITQKALCHAPPRLQRMLLRLQKYDFILRYKPGKDLNIADTLLRAYIPDCSSDRMEEELTCAVNLVISNIPVTDKRMQEIRDGTKNDKSLRILQRMILNGWPDSQSQIPEEVRPYWNIRDELSEAAGVLLKGERLIIPSCLQQDILQPIHMGHMGITKCTQRAREVVFWPGMNKEITEMVEKCDACQNYQYSNQKEPMVQGQIPEGPWDMVATDLFQWDGADYLLIVDYYSRFIEFCRLPNTSSSMVHTKSIFARHGIPKSVRSDNGPQLSAMEYSKFAMEWGFAHITSSPYHPQSNGLPEKSVQIIKRMLNKSKRDGQYSYLSLLELRNTRVGDIGSPVQLLMGRRLRTSLPVNAEPRTINPDSVKSHLQQEQHKRKLYYDEGSKPMIPLQKGENAWMQVQGEWKPVKVLDTAEAPASYLVKTASGKVYRRDRKHLRPRRADDPEDQSESDLEVDSERGQEQVNNQKPDDDNSGLQGQPGVPPATLEEVPKRAQEMEPGVPPASLEEVPKRAQEVEVQNRQQAEVRTSSGRLVRKPQRYKDFVAL